MSGSGYRLRPHTADVTVSAWGQSRDRCLAEAVRGLVAVFADTRGLSPVRLTVSGCTAASNAPGTTLAASS